MSITSQLIMWMHVKLLLKKTRLCMLRMRGRPFFQRSVGTDSWVEPKTSMDQSSVVGLKPDIHQS